MNANIRIYVNLYFLKEDYRTAIDTALSPSQSTLDSYRQQHVAFVQHANTTIQVGSEVYIPGN